MTTPLGVAATPSAPATLKTVCCAWSQHFQRDTTITRAEADEQLANNNNNKHITAAASLHIVQQVPVVVCVESRTQTQQHQDAHRGKSRRHRRVGMIHECRLKLVACLPTLERPFIAGG